MSPLTSLRSELIKSFRKYLTSFLIQKGNSIRPVVLSSTHSPFSLDSTVHLYAKFPRRYSFNRQSEDKPKAKQFKASSSLWKSSCQLSKETVYESGLTVRLTV